MGRLIDADKLLEETRRDRDYARKNGFLDMYYERQVLIDRIEAQPTAYSVDEVVEELEQHYDDDSVICGLVYNDAIKKAIEIVKAGGTSDR